MNIYTKFIVVMFLLYGCFNDGHKDNIIDINSTKIKNISINYIDSLIVQIDSIAINDAKLIHITNDILYWFDSISPELFIFNRDLSLSEHIDYTGRGPGEFNTSYKIDISKKNNIRIYDFQTKKINIFNGLRNYSSSFHFSEYEVNRLAAVDDSRLFLQLRNIKSDLDPAFILIDTAGVELMNGGKRPENAIIQDVISGGSIAYDKNENIYYSYGSDYRIWKVNLKTQIITIFNNKPVYFLESEAEEIRKLNQREYAKYYFEHSRTWNIFYVEPNLIVQQIYPQRPQKNNNYSYLEIFDTTGIKVGTKILFQNEIINVQNGKIYCKSVNEDNFSKYKKVEIYEIKI